MTLGAKLRYLIASQAIFEDQQTLLRTQARLIADRQDEIRRLKLEHAREMRGLVGGWLLHLESPEIDMRHELAELDMSLAHRAAALEEHVL